MTATTTADLSFDLGQLLNAYCDREGLSNDSADELVVQEGITAAQRAWLDAWIALWDLTVGPDGMPA